MSPPAPAGACGGLVGENGTIQLTRTSTLAAYHDGVERYVTSFEFTGTGEAVGSIIPLPDIPDRGRAGRRLDPAAPGPGGRAAASRTVPSRRLGAALDRARAPRCILETQIDALDITVLKGGGDEVGTWARDNGFLLTPDAPEMLDFYGHRSQIFMAARFDAARAAELGQTAGDGTPIMLTIPTDAPWVPLRILSLGLDGSKLVRGRRVPPHRRRARPARRRARPQPRAQRAGQRAAARRPPLRHGHGVGARATCGSPTCRSRPRPRDLDYDLAISPDERDAPDARGHRRAGPEARPCTRPDAALPVWPHGRRRVVAVLVAGDRPRRGQARRGTAAPA